MLNSFGNFDTFIRKETMLDLKQYMQCLECEVIREFFIYEVFCVNVC